jgi:DNA-binding NarL/FixJ family response regulator
LEKTTIRVLLVDDYEPWRAFVASTLQKQADLRIIGQATNGAEGVQIAQRLQPDLILLDIGLPKLNGVEAARRILEVCPRSKILFASENRSREIAETALRIGGGGYVVKAASASELLPAIEAVLKGEQFVSASLTGPALADHELVSVEPSSHEVGFYSDDRQLLDGATQFIGAALEAGNAAIVVATESHRNNLVPRLQARGIDIATVTKQSRYIAVDAAESLTTCMVGDALDPVQFMEIFAKLIVAARNAAQNEHLRVAVFGECAQLLWAQGNAHAAIQDEELCNELVKLYDVDILCGYSVESPRESMDSAVLHRICAEHAAVHGLGQ